MMGAIAASWSLLTWFLTSYSKEEYARLAEELRTAALRGAEILEALCDKASASVSRLQKNGASQASLSEVAEMLDIVRLGLTAGLSFDAALEIFCQNRCSDLSDELGKAMALWQTGTATRTRALEIASRNLGARALESFAATVGQSLALGAPLAEALASQSAEIRAARRAEVERQIERAPVKLVIPTGTLILPALLLSILGPLLAAGGMV